MKTPAVVFLVGFMGAGKTTVGREVARCLDCPFEDLDDRIVARERRSVSEIFARSGEAEFRRCESRALHELLREMGRRPALVVALGGGAWSQPQNRLRVREAGAPVVFLDAPLEVLRSRCAPRSGRPLDDGGEGFRALYEARRKDYALADVRIDTAGKSPAEIAGEVIASLQQVSIPSSVEGP
jgi:shikimate kinase